MRCESSFTEQETRFESPRNFSFRCYCDFEQFLLNSRLEEGAGAPKTYAKIACMRRVWLSLAHFETNTTRHGELQFCSRFMNFGFCEGKAVVTGEQQEAEREISVLSFLPCRLLIDPPPSHRPFPGIGLENVANRARRVRDRVAFQMLHHCLIPK